MIDWQIKVQELKQTADELDLWAAKSGGRQRTVLGRIADELRQFAAEIYRELVPPDEDQQASEVPDWLAAIVVPSADEEAITGETFEQDYVEGDDEWPEGWDDADAALA
jgi:hypothetical protein